MRYIAAYLLAALGGTENPSSKELKKILDSVGIEADDTRMDKVGPVLQGHLVLYCQDITLLTFVNLFSLFQVINELSGKNVQDVIAQGYGKLASVPAGGSVAVSSSAASGGPAAAAPAAAEEKKEEKKEESEESDDDMGFGLFD
ncbi:large ribosomal subunit protein P2-like isoform X1 [Lepisosteus oculatus]|uniref:large ribosomal subunit protein P2-like isoform X1 n=1 Tax=Lepisosteus oculatus TaxID=7918 RepID=UPI0035F4FFE1